MDLPYTNVDMSTHFRPFIRYGKIKFCLTWKNIAKNQMQRFLMILKVPKLKFTLSFDLFYNKRYLESPTSKYEGH